MRCAPKRCGSVIAVVVVAILLLASPSPVGAPVARAADPPIPTLIPTDPIELGRSFFPSPTALETAQLLDKQNRFFLDSIKANALSYKLIGAQIVGGVLLQAGLSWVLNQWGLGDGVADQIAAIGQKLDEIQNTLNQIQAATEQLRAELANSHFANLVSQATTIVSEVNTDTKELDAIAHLPSGDLTRRNERTHLLLRLIEQHLLSKQQELADRISGTVGADGLIAAAYKVALANHRLWTLQTSAQVRAVAAYYEAAETRLLLLRIEYMHAHPKAFTDTDIQAAISEVDGYLKKQDGQLKPEPGAGVIADTRTDREWFWPPLDYVGNFAAASTLATDVGASGLYPVPTFGTVNYLGISIPTITGFVNHDVGKGWRLPSYHEVLNFIAGWSDPSGSWVHWLHRETGGLISTSAAPHGVWADLVIAGMRVVFGIDTSGAVLALHQDPLTNRSPFLVRTRTHTYW